MDHSEDIAKQLERIADALESFVGSKTCPSCNGPNIPLLFSSDKVNKCTHCGRIFK